MNQIVDLFFKSFLKHDLAENILQTNICHADNWPQNIFRMGRNYGNNIYAHTTDEKKDTYRDSYRDTRVCPEVLIIILGSDSGRPRPLIGANYPRSTRETVSLESSDTLPQST